MVEFVSYGYEKIARAWLSEKEITKNIGRKRMWLFKSLIVIFLLIDFRVDASVSLDFKATKQGYWYGKAYIDDHLIPSDVRYEAFWDLCSKMSSAELLCFLSGILRDNHPV